MASARSLAARRTSAVARLESVKDALQARLSLVVEDQPLTNRDPELAQIQQVENIAAFMESVLATMGGNVQPEPEVFTFNEAMPEPEPVEPEPIVEPVAETPEVQPVVPVIQEVEAPKPAKPATARAAKPVKPE